MVREKRQGRLLREFVGREQAGRYMNENLARELGNSGSVSKSSEEELHTPT